MKITPIYDRVLIKIIDEKQNLTSGLIIPDSAKEKPTKGVVIAVGHGFYKANGEHQALKIKPNDCVLFNQWAANSNKLKDGNDELIIIKEDDILAIIQE